MSTVDSRPTLQAPDDDPYLWLEEIEGPRALAWVEAQSAATLKAFGDAAWERDRAALAAIYDRPDNLPWIVRRGARLYNFWTDAQHPRGLWRSTTLASYAGAEPDWTVLLDLDALAAAEQQDWVWRGAATLPGTHDRALLSLSPGGGDAVVLREFDLGRRAFVAGGFDLPLSKSGAVWLDRDTLLVSSPLGKGAATRSGYARIVRRWSRGGDPLRAPAVFACQFESMAVGAEVSRPGGTERVWFVERQDFQNYAVWLGDREGPRTRIDLPTDARFDVHGDWLAVMPRIDWAVDGRTYRGGSLLGLSLAALLEGRRDFDVLFVPAPRRAVQGFFWSGGDLVLSLLDHLRPAFERWRPSDSGWSVTPITGLPDEGTAFVQSLDACEDESTGELIGACQGPLVPPSLFLLQPGRPPRQLKSAPHAFDARGLVVTRHEALSSDGESIPYVQVGPAEPAGDAPVHMTGYGGFGLSSHPWYNAGIGKLWLERGGTSVITHLRGGGEFGPEWHEAGRRAGKRLSHDDFAAVAADLVRRGVTRPQRIAAEGGSNGGLLVSNMLTRYPERFGALFCTIPLIDLRRYTRLLAGPSWVAEYGDPDVPEDWAFLSALSAYHVAAPGQEYPPILLASNRHDDRVHPGHARKMAAKLLAMGHAAHLYELAAGGHAYGKDSAQRAAFAALGYAFLRRSIGWIEPEVTSAEPARP